MLDIEAMERSRIKLIHIDAPSWDHSRLVVGRAIKVRKHENADRLIVITVDYGGPKPVDVSTSTTTSLNCYRRASEREIPVFNLPYARKGAWAYEANTEENPRPLKKIKRSNFRGLASKGMVCSEVDIGLSDDLIDHDDVIWLPYEAPIGQPLFEYLSGYALKIPMPKDNAYSPKTEDIARMLKEYIHEPQLVGV
jgi:phenylalanyl-tRNA synthetase beta chain